MKESREKRCGEEESQPERRTGLQMTVIMWTLRTGADLQGQEGAEQGERGRNTAKTQRNMRETAGSKRLKEKKWKTPRGNRLLFLCILLSFSPPSSHQGWA